MTKLAVDEQWGASAEYVLASGNVRMGLPHGEGGRRLYVVKPSASGCTVTLPVALFLPTPSEYCIVNLGTAAITVVYAIIGVPFVVIPAGQQATVYLLNQNVPWGTWLAKLRFATGGTTLPIRTPLDIVLDNSTVGPIDLRRYAIGLGATSDSTPYAIRCTVKSGTLIGSNSGNPALFSGQWPANSTMLLIVESGAIISGKGGDGGRGGDLTFPGILPQPGAAGGLAVVLDINATVVNAGRIQGGGGGGGGAAANGGQAGGGGGGGAGAYLSRGGNGGSPTGNAGGAGTPTSPGLGGAGPSFNGGNGGFPGLAGVQPASGGLGGNPGFGITRFTGRAYTYLAPGGASGSPYLLGGTQVL
jgi:hypothetical protein